MVNVGLIHRRCPLIVDFPKRKGFFILSGVKISEFLSTFAKESKTVEDD